MATRIRLRRMGANKRPFYRVVVADQRSPRDGRFIENIGKYHPLEDPSLIEIDEERALHWLRVGAQPSDQVRNLMVKVGIWDTFVAERPSAAGKVRVRDAKPDEPKLSKKAVAKAAAAAEEALRPGRGGSPPGGGTRRRQSRPTEVGVPRRGGDADRRAGRGRRPNPRRHRGVAPSCGSSSTSWCSELVDDPDAVEVTESEDDRGMRYTVRVAPDDMGKVIGKGGRTAKAIRAVVRAAATRAGHERLRRHRRLRCPSRPSSSVTSRGPTASAARSPSRCVPTTPTDSSRGRSCSPTSAARSRSSDAHAHGARHLVKFAGVDDRDAAESLRGQVLVVPESWLPELPEGEYWPFQLEGCEVVTESGRSLGIGDRGDPQSGERPVGRRRRRTARRRSSPRSATWSWRSTSSGKRVLVRDVPGLTAPDMPDHPGSR